jgi:maleylacetate reductase
MDAFQYRSHAQEVIFGAGSLARLTEAVERRGWQRLMMCTSPAYRHNGRAAALEALLGERLLAVYDSVLPHVQDHQVMAVNALGEENSVDAIIGLGGGSPIGMAKAAAFTLSQGCTVKPPTAVVAVPTTYAGSEMTPIFGVTHTDEDPPRKVTVSDPAIAPALVIYDPELTLDLPPQLTASSGINALAHCIEALYSITRHPLSSAAALSGLRHIYSALPRCHSRGGDLAARAEMLLGAHLAGLSLASVKLGLHHGMCHVLGGSAGVPHGIANSIMLPHAVRFNAPAAAAQLLPAAEAMGIPAGDRDPAAAVEGAAQHIAGLVGQMGLPQRLRDAGVPENDLHRLAQIGFNNKTVQSNPRRIESVDQLERLLRDAW